MLTDKDLAALKLFTETYPNWWYQIGVDAVACNFDCAPNVDSTISLCEYDFFTCSHSGSLADAIEDVMKQIEEAKPK